MSMEAEQHIPYPMNEVNYDFEILGRSPIRRKPWMYYWRLHVPKMSKSG